MNIENVLHDEIEDKNSNFMEIENKIHASIWLNYIGSQFVPNGNWPMGVLESYK